MPVYLLKEQTGRADLFVPYPRTHGQAAGQIIRLQS